jgi:hypothetical protein
MGNLPPSLCGAFSNFLPIVAAMATGGESALGLRIVLWHTIGTLGDKWQKIRRLQVEQKRRDRQKNG